MACAQPEEINKQLCCAVCFEQFKEPKVLPCLHTYCKGCLVKLVKKKGRNHIITCPECRQEVKVSSIIMKDVTCVVTNVSQNEKNIIFLEKSILGHLDCALLCSTTDLQRTL